MSANQDEDYWKIWWEDIPVGQKNTILANITAAWEKSTGLDSSIMTSGQHKDFVMTASSLENQGITASADKLEKWATEGSGSNVHVLSKQFQTALTRGKSSYRDQFKEGGLQGFFSEADYEKRFTEKYREFNGEEVGVITSDILAAAMAEFNTAVEDGTVDAETGKPLDEAVGKVDTQIKDMMKTLGIDLSPAAQEHFSKLLRTNELDAFEVEQMLKSSPEFQQKVMAEQYALAKDQITEAEKRELSILADEAVRTQKMTEEDFKRIAPELAQFAKRLGGRTREDTFIGDTLVKERADLERRREDQLAISRQTIKFGQESRRQALEEGQFGETRAITSQIQTSAMQNFEKLLQQREKTQARLAQVRSQKSSLLASRSYDRYQRDIQKRMDRANRTAMDAAARANKKARKFGGFAQIGMGAIQGFIASGFNPAGAVVGGALGYAQSQLTNQGIQAPQVNFQKVGEAFKTVPQQYTYDAASGKYVKSS